MGVFNNSGQVCSAGSRLYVERPVYEEVVARLAACVTALAAGPLTAAEVARLLTWTRRERPFADLDTFNAMLATSETITHLELLAGRGQVARERRDGIVRYAAASTVWSKTSAPSSIR